MFRKAGYTRDGKTAPLPEAPLTLYRAAWDDVADGRFGLSWTSEPRMIEYYGCLSPRDGRSRPVWEAEFPPERLLCSVTTQGEYIADAKGLDVREMHPAGSIEHPLTRVFRNAGLM